MAFDKIFRGAPTSEVTPSSPESPNLAVDVVNDTLYVNTGQGWTEVGAGIVNGITQLTGDVTAGPGTGSQAATLANTAVTPGSYTNSSITVDHKGRVTAASSGTAPANSYVQLSQQVLGTTASSLTASIPAGYTQIEIELTSLCDQSLEQPIRLTFNSDTGTNYDATTWSVSGLNQTPGTFNATHSLYVGNAQGTTDAGRSGTANIKLSNYSNASIYKNVDIFSSYWLTSNSQWRQETIVGSWDNTASAITAVGFALDAGNFAAGTTLTIYGIK